MQVLNPIVIHLKAACCDLRFLSVSVSEQPVSVAPLHRWSALWRRPCFRVAVVKAAPRCSATRRVLGEYERRVSCDLDVYTFNEALA